jgi:hypothetical protein
MKTKLALAALVAAFALTACSKPAEAPAEVAAPAADAAAAADGGQEVIPDGTLLGDRKVPKRTRAGGDTPGFFFV